jgi:hypothetical protein
MFTGVAACVYSSDVNKAWRVKAKTKAKVTVFWPAAKAKAKA